jgi:hypothetical protein
MQRRIMTIIPLAVDPENTKLNVKIDADTPSAEVRSSGLQAKHEGENVMLIHLEKFSRDLPYIKLYALVVWNETTVFSSMQTFYQNYYIGVLTCVLTVGPHGLP